MTTRLRRIVKIARLMSSCRFRHSLSLSLSLGLSTIFGQNSILIWGAFILVEKKKKRKFRWLSMFTNNLNKYNCLTNSRQQKNQLNESVKTLANDKHVRIFFLVFKSIRMKFDIRKTKQFFFYRICRVRIHKLMFIYQLLLKQKNFFWLSLNVCFKFRILNEVVFQKFLIINNNQPAWQKVGILNNNNKTIRLKPFWGSFKLNRTTIKASTPPSD